MQKDEFKYQYFMSILKLGLMKHFDEDNDNES